jgi:hypothetical protein
MALIAANSSVFRNTIDGELPLGRCQVFILVEKFVHDRFTASLSRVAGRRFI